MGLLSTLQGLLSNIAIALITIFVGFIIAKLCGRIAKRVLAEAELNRILSSAGFNPVSDSLATLIEYIIYAITLLVVLQEFGLTKIVLGIIALIAVLAIGFSLILTLRDFIPNAIIGLIFRKDYKKYLGKQVIVGSVKGRLEHIGAVAITLRDKDEHCVPHLYTSKHNIKPLRAS